jgi:uncharacterized protein (DUF2384 family)
VSIVCRATVAIRIGFYGRRPHPRTAGKLPRHPYRGATGPALQVGVELSYDSDMLATDEELRALLNRVNDATRLLQRSTTVTSELAALIDSFDRVLGASTPVRLEADPYLTATLWAAAFRAEKALRHDNDEDRRRDVRIALEQFRHALRDIVENRPYDDGAPVRDVLARTADALSAPQKELAELLGVSVRQLQRWSAVDGSAPAASDAARIRAVGHVVNQLRHTFTGPGVIAWFNRQHPVLKKRPVDLLDDPLSYPGIYGAATAARAMSA